MKTFLLVIFVPIPVAPPTSFFFSPFTTQYLHCRSPHISDSDYSSPPVFSKDCGYHKANVGLPVLLVLFTFEWNFNKWFHASFPKQRARELTAKVEILRIVKTNLSCKIIGCKQ